MVFFVKILEEFARIDKVNEYYILVSPKNGHLFKVVQENFHYVNCFVSQEKRFLRIFVSQFVIPLKLWQYKIDIYFSPQNISPFIIPNRSKVIVYLYGTHHWRKVEYLGLLRTVYRRIVSFLAKYQTEQFVANSQTCKTDIMENLRVSFSKITVVYEALDHSLFNNQSLTTSEIQLLHESNLELKKYILFVSMINHYKNIKTLIEAFVKLALEFSEYRLLLIGRNEIESGKNRKYWYSIQNIINENALNEKVKFIGHVPHHQLPTFYKGAKIFVQPSFYETFGKTVIESMACGTPVIGSNTGATLEVIGDAGLTFDPHSTDELYKNLKLLLNDFSLYGYFIKKGIERASQFTFKNQAESLISVFSNAL